jgi:long-subunit fatty acid transport protein
MFANTKSFNGDFGAAFKVIPQLTLAAVYKNILGDKKNLEPRIIAGGLSYDLLPELTITGALEKYSATSDSPLFGVPNDNKITWAVGGQYMLKAQGLSLRAGYREAAAWNKQLACAGIGYTKESFQLDYSLIHVLKGEKTSIHTFGLGLNF